MSITSRALQTAIAVVASLGATQVTSQAFASSVPSGVWYDHTGRGAVEITQCGGNLCGRVVWLKDAGNNKACGVQIIGNARPTAPGTWDRGWIFDPERGNRYSVEIKPMGDGRLQVMGYAGSKYLNETMVWRRAPSGLKRCAAA